MPNAGRPYSEGWCRLVFSDLCSEPCLHSTTPKERHLPHSSVFKVHLSTRCVLPFASIFWNQDPTAVTLMFVRYTPKIDRLHSGEYGRYFPLWRRSRGDKGGESDVGAGAGAGDAAAAGQGQRPPLPVRRLKLPRQQPPPERFASTSVLAKLYFVANGCIDVNTLCCVDADCYWLLDALLEFSTQGHVAPIFAEFKLSAELNSNTVELPERMDGEPFSSAVDLRRVVKLWCHCALSMFASSEFTKIEKAKLCTLKTRPRGFVFMLRAKKMTTSPPFLFQVLQSHAWLPVSRISCGHRSCAAQLGLQNTRQSTNYIHLDLSVEMYTVIENVPVCFQETTCTATRKCWRGTWGRLGRAPSRPVRTTRGRRRRRSTPAPPRE